MNRFLTKRKAKREQPMPRFQLDISNALPKNDDFRTSLIMGSLSKRFSMLREQDDPNSMLGKASDDSVLAPNRQSRLMDFGYSPGRTLADIAEVSSIRETASIRPPFAQERSNSFASDAGYDSNDDSLNNGGVMNRARPGEGNNLFGGRQKIYKIPSSSESSGLGGMNGRYVYDDDVSSSAFQRWRQEERERLAKQQAAAGAEQDSAGKAAPLSPTFPPTITRQTSSSTATSAPYNGRGSTAATSVTSQVSNLPSSTPATTASYASTNSSGSPALDRNNTKNRRLYDLGLNRDIEDQQSTAMSRLNSIQKVRGRVSPPFGGTSPRGGLPEVSESTTSQRGSPTSFPSGPFSATEKAAEHTNPSSPLDTYTSPLDSSLNPNDRGKATALGAFNKPQQFNERQYMERQLTLRGARDRLDLKRDEAKPSVELDRSESLSQTNPGVTRPRNGSIQQDAFSVFQNAASLMRKPVFKPEPEVKEKPLPEPALPSTSIPTSTTESELPVGHESHLQPPVVKAAAVSPSPRIPQIASFAQPPDHEHPAFKSRISQADSDSSSIASARPRPQNFSTPFRNRGSQASDSSRKNTTSVVSVDSVRDVNTTLGLANGGLSGLIWTHLRQNSGASSVYAAEDAPPLPEVPQILTVRTSEPRAHSPPLRMPQTEDITPADSTVSNPFDLDDIKSESRVSPVRQDSSDQETPLQTSPKHVRAGRRRGMSTTQEESWQYELKKSHIRGPSAETIQEQDALSVEIAKRQRAIQEKLMAAKGSDSQTTSPSEDKPVFGPFRGLELLRNKSSRENVKKESQAQTIGSNKAGRMLGLAAERPSFQGERPRPDQPTYSASVRSRSTSRPATGRSASQRLPFPNIPDSARPSIDRPTFDDRERPVTRERKASNPPPPALFTYGRSRSRANSNAGPQSGRSTSNGGYSDNEPPTPPVQPIVAEVYSGKRSLEQANGLHIHTSRSPTSNVPFENTGLFPPPMASPLSASSTASSPILPIQGALLSPNLPISPRQSPNGFSPVNVPSRPGPQPFHVGVATPPLSGTSTPVVPMAPTFPTVTQMPPPPVAMSQGTRARSQSRKKSIHKTDISEPVLISTTSVIDTISLPAGASLRNGMDESGSAPPVPPLNPMRRKFGFGGRNTPNGHIDEFRPSTGYVTSGRSVSSSSGGSKTSFGNTSASREVSGTEFYPTSSDEAKDWKSPKGSPPRFQHLHPLSSSDLPAHQRHLRKSSSEGDHLNAHQRMMKERVKDEREMQMELMGQLKGMGKGPIAEGGMF